MTARSARANATDAQRALRDYDEKYLMCRDLKHPWKVVGYFHENGQVKRVLQCTRCKTTRTDAWRKTGERIKSRYQHSDGYLLRKMTFTVSAYDVRREVLNRVTIYRSEAEMFSSIATKGKK